MNQYQLFLLITQRNIIAISILEYDSHVAMECLKINFTKLNQKAPICFRLYTCKGLFNMDILKIWKSSNNHFYVKKVEESCLLL